MADPQALRVELRPLRDDELAAVEAILVEPSVARWWWREHDDLRDEFEDPQAILVDGELAGVLDIWVRDDGGAGLDISLSTPYQDRGIGRRALALAVEEARRRGHARVTIDPEPDNLRAIRCYESVAGLEIVSPCRRPAGSP
jgi:aminoglycoside 6'-N-acetyltransferase